ncbi:MAG: type II toxin-antitoxin system VapC family toxin [Vicinamibacterales bacterium]
MIVHLDTSVLVDALTGTRRSLPALERTVAAGHVIATTALALSEWLRGPRTAEDLEDQELLLPSAEARGFGPAEARRAADLYRTLKRARGRDLDLAIAACALEHGAHIWTLNANDFRDIPGLKLYKAA